jgi:hypothetical protein
MGGLDRLDAGIVDKEHLESPSDGTSRRAILCLVQGYWKAGRVSRTEESLRHLFVQNYQEEAHPIITDETDNISPDKGP